MHRYFLGALIMFFIMFLSFAAFAGEFTVIRSYDVHRNVEHKVQTGIKEVCKEYNETSNEDLIKRGIIGGIIGNQIGDMKGNAMLGAVLGVMSAQPNQRLKSACYEEITYRTEIGNEYSHTIVVLSDGVREWEQRIVK